MRALRGKRKLSKMFYVEDTVDDFGVRILGSTVCGWGEDVVESCCCCFLLLF